jgi:hypothetical protein
MTNHPITTPPELLDEWLNLPLSTKEILVLAAQWGADQELEACCEWLHWQNLATHSELIPSLRAARRPKPPSLNSIALEMLGTIEKMDVVIPEITDTIRRALEQLDD